MEKENWLICGTQIKNKSYKRVVFKILDKQVWNERFIYKDWKPESIIEGCCQDSADSYAEEWAIKEGINIQHFPSTSGNYLKRNIEMVRKLTRNDLVIAFWDGFSYGTAHTIANATARKIPVMVIFLKDFENLKDEVELKSKCEDSIK